MKTMQRREGISLEYLVKKAQQGDGCAFIELMEANKQNMYKIARSYFSNEEGIADAIQDTIESCYKSLPYLDKTEYFRTWLTRILINKCIDIIKKNKRESPVDVFPEQGEICMDLRHCEFEELMRRWMKNTARSSFSTTGRGSRSARSHSFLIWRKIQ